jgi:hypothetical protein
MIINVYILLYNNKDAFKTSVFQKVDLGEDQCVYYHHY